MSRQKKSKAVPVVIIITVILAALCVACFFAGDAIQAYRDATLQKKVEEVEAANAKARQEYAAALAEFEKEKADGANQAWPAQKTEGWDVLDLTNYPLESPYTVSMTRAEVMDTGMLLVNQWHSRPDDFDETAITSIGRYTDWKIQVEDANVKLFPVAIDAFQEAVNAAAEEGMTHYLVTEGYRTWDEQNTLFQNRMNKLSNKYSGNELIEAAKKEVNYPGTSEYNTGLAFRLRLYDKNDASVTASKYSTSAPGVWMNENCWKYGIVFRFQLADWPLEGNTDKSYKTGISTDMNLYRYVGKGNACVMHVMDFCLEEYVEYLQAHPHIAVFDNGQLKYEIVRQYVGDNAAFNVELTSRAKAYTVSLDNMGAVITVFEY